ncbi:MAG: 30S ribosomal protein S27e, partial [Nitrosopumilaceae archaeon]|nr:30S ribosomal protein S27e [Nitrosopumilaceae archaeon]
KFLKVGCGECGEVQVVYSHASTSITCNSCGNEIAKPSGAVAKLNGKVSGNAE